MKNPVFIFLLKAFGLYILWYILYEFWLHPQGKLDLFLIDNLILISSGILKFLGFIVAYPGAIVRKFIYIPAGILIIHLMNVLRLIGLSLITLYAPEYLEINHTYTFTILVYSCVFILWMLWANKFSKPKINK